MIKVGCCGFPKAKKEYYAHFPVVEVQQTFYQPPKVETAQKWRAEAPPGFEFTLKTWQLITHPPSSPTYRRLKIEIDKRDRYGFFRPTDEVLAAWERTREIAGALEAQIVLFQCPASFTPTKEHIANMRAFFRAIERDGLHFIWEPRGEWEEEEIKGLCQELDLIHGVDPFQRPPVYGEIAYFRLHGISGYRYRYTAEDLNRLLQWCQEYEKVYCLFNNITMFEDALRMKEMVGDKKTTQDRPHIATPGEGQSTPMALASETAKSRWLLPREDMFGSSSTKDGPMSRTIGSPCWRLGSSYE